MRVAKRTETETAVWVLIVVLLGVVWFASLVLGQEGRELAGPEQGRVVGARAGGLARLRRLPARTDRLIPVFLLEPTS